MQRTAASLSFLFGSILERRNSLWAEQRCPSASGKQRRRDTAVQTRKKFLTGQNVSRVQWLIDCQEVLKHPHVIQTTSTFSTDIATFFLKKFFSLKISQCFSITAVSLSMWPSHLFLSGCLTLFFMYIFFKMCLYEGDVSALIPSPLNDHVPCFRIFDVVFSRWRAFCCSCKVFNGHRCFFASLTETKIYYYIYIIYYIIILSTLPAVESVPVSLSLHPLVGFFAGSRHCLRQPPNPFISNRAPDTAWNKTAPGKKGGTHFDRLI